MKRISLIVPVYNASPYLPAFLASALDQDWDDLQVILSDDGSTDGSRTLIQSWAQRDRRVTAVLGENRGVSAARNRALALADGDYIGFADADDQLLPGYLKTLAAALEDADMACCGFDRVYERTGTMDHLPLSGQRRVTDRDGMVRLLLRPDGYTTVMWNKLFRRQALTEPDGTLLRFDETLHIVEDGEYILRSAVQRAVFLPERYYRYYVRTGGAMYGPLTDRKRTELSARRKIVALTADLSPEAQDLAKMKYQKGVRDLMLHAVISGQGAAVRDLRPELSVYARELFRSPALSAREKLKYHVYRPIIQMDLRHIGAFLMDKLSGH